MIYSLFKYDYLKVMHVKEKMSRFELQTRVEKYVQALHCKLLNDFIKTSSTSFNEIV